MEPEIRVWRWWQRSLEGGTAWPPLSAIITGFAAVCSAFALLMEIVFHPGDDARPMPAWFAFAALAFVTLVCVVAIRQHVRRTARPEQRAPILRLVEIFSLGLLVPFYRHLLRELPAGIATGEIAPLSSSTMVLAQVAAMMSLVTATIRAARASLP